AAGGLNTQAEMAGTAPPLRRGGMPDFSWGAGLSRRARWRDVVLGREQRRLRSILDTELLENRADVAFHGADAQVERRGNSLVAFAAREQREHVPLARRQRHERRRRFRFRDP